MMMMMIAMPTHCPSTKPRTYGIISKVPPSLASDPNFPLSFSGHSKRKRSKTAGTDKYTLHTGGPKIAGIMSPRQVQYILT